MESLWKTATSANQGTKFKMLLVNLTASLCIIMIMVTWSRMEWSVYTSCGKSCFEPNHNLNITEGVIEDTIAATSVQAISWTNPLTSGYHGNFSISCHSNTESLALQYPSQNIGNYNLTHLQYLPNFRSPCWIYQKTAKSRTEIACLPAVFLAGMPKCGTSDLWSSLTEHPLLIRGRSKEPHYWSRFFHDSSTLYYSRKLNSSAVLQEGIEVSGQCHHNSLTVDGSASTFWDSRKRGSEMIPQIIHRVLPNAKIIVILRDPVERIYSEYLYFHPNKSKNADTFHDVIQATVLSFEECSKKYSTYDCTHNTTMRRQTQTHKIAYTSARLFVGMYHIYLQDWLKYYPRSSLHFLRLEDYSKNRIRELDKVSAFINIEPSFSAVLHDRPQRSKVHVNARDSQSSQLGDMHAETRTLLQQFYAPFNRQLSQMLGSDAYKWGYS